VPPSPPNPDGFGWLSEVVPAATAALGGLIGRLMALSQERRDMFTLGLFVWEIPTVIGMGLIARGVADYLGWTGFVGFALTIVSGYLGPRIVSNLVQLVVDQLARKAP